MGLLHRCQVHATPLPGVHVTLTESARPFPRHWHGTFGVGLIDDGAQRSASGRGPVEAFAGQVISHNPGEVHDGRPIGHRPRRWRMLHLEPSALAALLGLPSASALAWTDPVIAAPPRAQALHAALALGAPAMGGDAALFEEALLLAVGWIAEPRPRPRPADDRPSAGLARVMERLNDAPAAVPSLDELAALAGLSRYALVRQFGRCHGLPPMAWLQQLRLDQARRQIALGASLADAAADGGFSDQSHLTRQFVRQFGYTPGSWRRAMLARGALRARTF